MMAEHAQRSQARIIDYDTREGEIARRNVLFGLWAGRRMGLQGDALESYAWSVHFADYLAPGHDDMVAKVAVDLSVTGRAASDRHLRERLREMSLRASLDLAATDDEILEDARTRHRRTLTRFDDKQNRPGDKH